MIWRIRDRGTFAALGRAPGRAAGPVRVRTVRVEPGAGSAPEPPRVAYAIGRSVGNAVVRNRLRRRLRAAVAAHADRLVDGTVYLLAAGPRASAMSAPELSDAVATLLTPEPQS